MALTMDLGEVIAYEHIPPQLLQPPGRAKAVCLDLQIRGKSIAYLPGAGDSVAPCLEQMGYVVTPITGADLTSHARQFRRCCRRHSSVQCADGFG